jgi:hypothetical protein
MSHQSSHPGEVPSDPDDPLDFAARSTCGGDLFVLRGATGEGGGPERADGGDSLDLAAVSAVDWSVALAGRGEGEGPVVNLAEDAAAVTPDEAPAPSVARRGR